MMEADPNRPAQPDVPGDPYRPGDWDLPGGAGPLDRAFAAARAAAAGGEGPVGAVVVRDGVILAVAHTRPRLLNDPTAHAEILAIRAACAAIGDERLIG